MTLNLLQVRRERTLESTLAKLRKICIELGVDDAEAAAEVHPSLRSFHQSMRGHYFSFLETKDKAVSESSDQQNVRSHISAQIHSRLLAVNSSVIAML